MPAPTSADPARLGSEAGRPEVGRPGPDEHHAYYAPYIAAVPSDGLAGALASTPLADLLKGCPADLADHAYAPGKWTLATVAQHVIDTERVFSARALRIARGDLSPLPGFDQDLYAEAAPARGLHDLADELSALRASTRALFASLPPEALDRTTEVSGSPMSARAAGWIVAGHERHHAEVVRERYLAGP